MKFSLFTLAEGSTSAVSVVFNSLEHAFNAVHSGANPVALSLNVLNTVVSFSAYTLLACGKISLRNANAITAITSSLATAGNAVNAAVALDMMTKIVSALLAACNGFIAPLMHIIVHKDEPRFGCYEPPNATNTYQPV